MKDIFLSYSRDEQATARLFAEGFEAAGFSVWWDVTLKSGEDYDRVTEQALRGAKAVVVLWSAKSVESRWVRTEATIALQSKTLVPVMITPCQRPIMFELTQTADLSHWDGDAHDSVWLTFLHDVQQFVQRGVAKPVSESPTLTPASPPQTPPPRRPLPKAAKRYSPLQFWLRALPLTVIVAALVGLATWQLKPEAARPLVRFVHDLPDSRLVVMTLPGPLAIAQNGRRLVYSSTDGIVVRDLDTVEDRVITDTQERFALALSPDGESLAFFRRDGAGADLVRMPITGGAEVELAHWPTQRAIGTSWGADGTLLVGISGDGIYQLSENGGEPQRIVALEPNENTGQPQLLPGGEWILFTLNPGSITDLVTQSLVTGERKLLRHDASKGRYARSGHLLFIADNTLFAVAFDPESAEMSGNAVPVGEAVRMGTDISVNPYAVAADGTLAYVTGSRGTTDYMLAVGNKAGDEEALAVLPGAYGNPRASADGRRFAFEVQYSDGTDIAVWELGSATTPQRLTFGGNNTRPAWSADGTRIAYSSARADGPGIYWRLSDGSGTEERLTQAAEGETHTPDHFSPDGQYLAYTSGTESSSAIWLRTLTSDETKVLIESPGLGASHAVFAPDGHWLAYQGYDTGDNEIFVQPFPPTGAKYQLPSRVDNHHPLWSPDGRQLYYSAGPNSFERVDIVIERGVGFGNPVTLNPVTDSAPFSPRPYDIMPDGSILDLTREGGQSGPSRDRLIIVQNWFEVLQRLVPVQ